ncbi:splicing regulator SDE2 [Mixophyes fleayi]|uniref:splicing regulator SDE2 n=1 Tax=Mixophyes fleayi TaxID=3061075 RepID=UPI003F4DF921
MAALVWVRDAVSGRLSPCQLPPGSRVRELLSGSDSGRPWCDFYVKCNGRTVGPDQELQNGLVYSVEPRLCGGKGGFGSMLRALGAQIEKTTNREACRDLSGRRLRDVNHEKAMAEWIKKQADREAEKEQRRLERLKRKLAEPKHYFNDPEYDRQCSEMTERLEDSVIKGLQASSSTAVSADSGDSCKRRKGPQSDTGKSNKEKYCWSGMEGLEVSSSSESGSDSDSEFPCTSASCGNTVPELHSSESDSDGPAQSSSITAPDKQSPEPSAAASSVEEVAAVTDVEQPLLDLGHTAESTEVTAERETPAVTPEAQQTSPNTDPEVFDLLTFTSAAQLEALGLDKLKLELTALGVKCGGTLQERAARLFSVQGLSREQIDPELFPKPNKKKRK